MITLTNMSEKFEGEKFYIEPKNIMTIYIGPDEKGTKRTFVYGVTKDTWLVKETPAQILKLIDKE